MRKKRIAIIDKTGRGHSICDALIRTSKNVEIFYIPGTGGVFDSRITLVQDISILDKNAIAKFCKEKDINLAIVSHIDALRCSVADEIRDQGIPTLGVSSECAKLESSKWFMKKICQQFNILTPISILIESREELEKYIQANVGRSYMIKADWLTKHGNGAIEIKIGDAVADILRTINSLILQNPGNQFRFLVEEYIIGEDYSAHYIVNSSNYIAMPSCLDYKKSHDDDGGENCDGMGSISPHPLETDKINAQIEKEILHPLIEGMDYYGIGYDGPIYLGLRISGKNIYLLEINTRFGDSESEAMFPLVNEDLYKIIVNYAGKKLIRRPIKQSGSVSLALSIVTGSSEIDNNPNNGWPLTLSENSTPVKFLTRYISDSTMFYWANVKNNSNGEILAECGRVAHIVSVESSFKRAREKVYSSLPAIQFKGIRWRNDIGIRAILNNFIEENNYNSKTNIMPLIQYQVSNIARQRCNSKLWGL